jgi:prepilin-type N-terminal cleavage/methylation domain-containing protein/prepilin-type processing-associated H-X9-DG protein
MRKIFTLWRSRKLDDNGIEGVSLSRSMWSTRKAFTLTEMLVVIAILALLSRLLTPYLRKTLETARQVTCAKNLKELGTATFLHLDDNDDFIPHYALNIDGGTRERPAGMTEEYDDYRKIWFSEYNLGMYLFPNSLPPNDEGLPQNSVAHRQWNDDYANHSIYNCPSGKYSDATNYPMSYWVNMAKISYLDVDYSDHKSAWTNCWSAFSVDSDGNVEPYIKTSIHKIRMPSDLISIMDCAQDSDGKNNRGNAGELKKPSYAGMDDEIGPSEIGGIYTPIYPSSQNNVKAESTHNSYDFRHNEAINALFFDGRVTELINGTIPVAYVKGE